LTVVGRLLTALATRQGEFVQVQSFVQSFRSQGKYPYFLGDSRTRIFIKKPWWYQLAQILLVQSLIDLLWTCWI